MPSASTAAPDIFRAVADPTRRALLDQLRDGERTAGSIVERFATTGSAISQHLRILLEVGLVRRRRQGRQQLYSLDAAPLRTVADWVQTYEAFWNEKLDALGNYLAKQAANRPRRQR